ncbi:DUF2336 domain-containing protein [Methylobacterium oryzisoli]|uniref:DUF2336 domain-containing protein n=1 Tax=Methylobacterium oryzisoli TaxID=3385502 RepID=UPI0038925E0B
MSPLAELIDDAALAAEAADSAHHRRMLREITDLLVAQAPDLADGQVTVFDEVIAVLCESAGVEERGAVAERISRLPAPPPRLVRRFAADPAAPVAAPVLRRCRPIPDAVLLRIARTRGQPHLAAIAGREAVSERVAETLAGRGDEDVLQALVRNPGARLSDRALSLLAPRIADAVAFEAGLAAREDIPAERRAALLRSCASGRAVARRAAAKQGAERAARGTPVDAQQAGSAVALRIRIGLDEADIRHWLGSGRTTEAVFGLAHLAAVPRHAVLEALDAEDARPLLHLVRAAGLGPAVFAGFLRVRRRRSPPIAAQAASAGSH